eukprot:973006-Pelagomonas_calceolata.AAC.3
MGALSVKACWDTRCQLLPCAARRFCCGAAAAIKSEAVHDQVLERRQAACIWQHADIAEMVPELEHFQRARLRCPS